MKLVALGVLALLFVGALAQALAIRAAARQLQGMVAVLGAVRGQVRPDLPEAVLKYATRSGATGQARLIRFTQSAQMELKAGAGWQPYQARQWVDPTDAGFVWQAERHIAGIPVVSVIDSYVGGRGLLIARLGGSIPVARAEGDQIDRAEAMRYLAELPWAPDAILSNRALRWRVLAKDRWQVSLGTATVDLLLNPAGDIVEMRAQDRPSLENGQTVLREWRGVFSAHDTIAARRIPMRGEVGYMIDGTYLPYFRGRITAYQVD